MANLHHLRFLNVHKHGEEFNIYFQSALVDDGYINYIITPYS